MAKSAQGDVRGFGQTAIGLSRNPLGIIALFLVLVYGVAGLVTAFGSSLTPSERLPLIYFLVAFPVIVLAAFTWLVIHHSGKLFAPRDFRNEDNYVKMQLSAVASLTAASAKSSSGVGPKLEEIVDVVRRVPAASTPSLSPHILWVDDQPRNTMYLRQAFQAYDITFTLAQSTSEALERLSITNYDVIISDMGRQEGPREGYVLLDAIREKGDRSPFFIYSSSNDPEHKLEAARHGAQGATNDADELFEMVTRTLFMR